MKNDEGFRNWRPRIFYDVINNLGGLGKTLKQITKEYDDLSKEFRHGVGNMKESRNYTSAGVQILLKFGLLLEKSGKFIYAVHQTTTTPAPPPTVGIRLGEQGKPWLFPGGSNIVIDYDHEKEVLYFYPDPLY